MSKTYGEESRYTVERYFRLVEDGTLGPDDRVELLDGVIVAEPPQDPPHATAITLVADALRAAIGTRAAIREQMPLIVAPYSAPEPDVAVVAGCVRDYSAEHPRSALLVVEVAASSLPQDRLSKSRIYAAAAVPEYWIVNLREECVEVLRAPDQARRLYEGRSIAHPGERITLLSFPTTVAVDDLLPQTAPTAGT